MCLCVAVILYAISAVYFAGVMVRLMLTLTPVVCVLAAIAFSKTFDIYLKDDGRRDEDDVNAQESSAKYYDKVRTQVACLCRVPQLSSRQARVMTSRATSRDNALH